MIKKFFVSATSILIICLSISAAFSQDLKAQISVFGGSRVFVEIEFHNDDLLDKNLSFLQSYADAEKLGERVKRLQTFGVKGKEVSYKKFADGEFVTREKIKKVKYIVDAKVSQNFPANAHISWVNFNYGLIMLNDLFPQLNGEKISAKVTFKLSPDAMVRGGAGVFVNRKFEEFLKKENSKVTTGNFFNKVQFDTENIEDTIFIIGKNWREKEIKIEKSTIKFIIRDKWQFSDELAFKMAEEIAKEYVDLFGEMPVKNAQIVLLDFPKKMAKGRWRAETRGANITILSSQALATSFAKQRLHEQLRHEIFHLWIPNSLSLSGDYAWFYEGFAIYQALKTGVWLGQIRFEDFLNSLEQAYFLNRKRSGNISLIDISKKRWTGRVSSVYAKGMLVAFLCDAAMLKKSKGKRGVKDLFRELYNKHGKFSEKKVANISILKVLEQNNEINEIVNLYIKGNVKIDWTKYLSVFGIENLGSKTNANLTLETKLSRRQKALLKKLGYNRRRNFKRQKVIQN